MPERIAIHESAMAAVHDRLSDEDFQAAFTAGAGLELEEALELVSELVGQVEASPDLHLAP
jgi:hypothetical protein